MHSSIHEVSLSEAKPCILAQPSLGLVGTILAECFSRRKGGFWLQSELFASFYCLPHQKCMASAMDDTARNRKMLPWIAIFQKT